MRNIFFIITFCCVGSLQAQIQMADSSDALKSIGKAKRSGLMIAELMYKVDADNDTSYAIVYKNAEYETLTDIQHITFDGGGEVLNQLYQVLKSFFTEENKKNKDYKKQFTLGTQDLLVSSHKIMGSTVISIRPDKGYFELTEKELDKLFGK